MGYLALYRKYRPNTFDDLVGQFGVSSIIKNEILHNKVSHAYLFSGPRGTGKTSTAKIIAKMLNCSNLSDDGIPCGKCASCLNFSNNSDIVEIDAASNNGVDEIRELRDKVNLVPTYGKYKIYIIDEVHMLTTQAFNALLKTLEEPPSHAIFILATTEFYKIPATVVSRCQKFQFLKFSDTEIVDRLSKIADLENIVVSKDILYEIARLSDGGLRDAINMLDQLSSFKDGNVDDIADLYQLNGVISYLELYQLLMFIYDNDIVKIVNFVNMIDNTGKSVDKFINDLIELLKDILIFKNTSNLNYVSIEEKRNKIVDLSNIFSLQNIYEMIFSLNDLTNKIKNSEFSIILLVTYFIKLSNDLKEKSDSVNDIKIEKSDDNVVDNDAKDIDNRVFLSQEINSGLKKIRINNAFATASKKNKDDFLKIWINIKQNSFIKDYVNIVGLVDDIDVLVVGDNNIIFLAKYDSLLDRVYNYIEEFEEFLYKVFDIKYKIVFIAQDEWNYERNNYINNIKAGKKYEYIFEDESLTERVGETKDKKDDDIDKVISILGEDVISYN